MSQGTDQWFSVSDDGQLAVDVFRDGDDLVIVSLLAGVKSEDLDISIHGDLLTVRGTRVNPKRIAEEKWYSRECYWGPFSRSIVLPYDVDADRITASISNGILEIRIPIQTRKKTIPVQWES